MLKNVTVDLKKKELTLTLTFVLRKGSDFFFTHDYVLFFY